MLISFLANHQVRARMGLIFSLCLGILILALFAFPRGSGAKLQSAQEPQLQGKRRRPAFVPGEVLVRYRSESLAKSRTGLTQVTTREGFALPIQVERFDGSALVDGLRRARVPTGETLNAVAALRSQPEVLYAEPNYILRADVTDANDTRFGEQYGLTKIGAPVAWDTKIGSKTVVVGVIDQGIDLSHQDLAANIWSNPAEIPANGIDDDGNGFIDDVRGFNFVNNNGTIFSGADTETHASHVAGIIGAVGNNHKGVAGVNWSVGLMSLKFLDADGFGDTVGAILACNYAKQMRELWESDHTKGANIRVLNASFGGDAFTQSFLDTLNALDTAGILFVAAAGNIDDGTREPNNDLVPHYPSSFNAPNVIAVAATDSTDVLASFSHFGATTVDLGAPGVHILSTTPHCSDPGPPPKCQPTYTDPSGDTYTFFSGTSMSTPHVTGAAALLWAQNPNLTVQQVKNLLLLDGDVVAPLVDKTLTGRRLNVGNSFQSLSEGDTTAPGTVASFHINSQNGRTINLGWTASGDDGAAGQASLYQVNFTDGTSGAVIPLKGVVPKSSGSVQSVDVKIPFKHTSGTISLREFDNVGNEGVPVSLPIGVPLSSGDPYIVSEGSFVGLTVGLTTDVTTRLNPNADDSYTDYTLPFHFPFFGASFDTLKISTNGSLYFSPPPVRQHPPTPADTADDVPSSPRSLGGYKMIAGLWDDIDLRNSSRADSGVYVVQPSASRIIFRWQGVPCNFNGTVCLGGDPINFEIELNSDGTIKSRYGSTGNTELFPTVGIGGGEQDSYVIASHTSEDTEKSLTGAAEVTYTPRAQSTSTIQLEQSAISVGESAGQVNVSVTRSGDAASFATVNYTTSDTAGLANCTVTNGNASERCDYETAVGTLRFATGETTKTFIVPIVNDALVEGPTNETFTVTLSGVTGASLGTSTGTVTIVDNDTTPAAQNPIDDVQFFVTQQYIDFLGRLPDTTGLANWMATLNGCPNGGFGEFDNPGCDRVHVSAGFFQSTEFQGRGLFAYLFYEVALDRRPAYAEFVPDMAQVGGPQSPESEVLSKAAYTDAYVQRTEFKNRYDNLSNAAYVNALEVNAEVALANKAALIASLDTGQKTRAQVLREIVENNAVANRFFNRAFVAMQYFGYLRRDPDTTGYNNWVTTLENNPSDYRHMIFGFIFSTEYRQRFGP